MARIKLVSGLQWFQADILLKSEKVFSDLGVWHDC
jgi:hypothetical protein